MKIVIIDKMTLKIKFLILFLYLLSISSCKTKEVVSLTDYANSLYKKNIINKNPLILVNGQSIGLLHNINIDSLNIQLIPKESLSIIPKKIKSLEKYFGQDILNGGLEVSKTKTLNCSESPKQIYILNDKEMTLTEIVNTNQKIYYVVQLNDIKDVNNKYVKLTILSTKK